MKYFLLSYFILCSIPVLFSQTLLDSYYHIDNLSIIPKSTIEINDQMIMPYSLINQSNRLPGIAFFENQRLANAVAFEGDNEYVINQVLVSEDNTLLVSAEGYSYNGQESMYFMELENGQIINDFIFNENGNELDPFALEESNDGVFVAGFLKERELINNSFFNMYSEKQHIYVGEFKKTGEKMWSKSIAIKGFNTGICNAMLKHSNHLILLCHARNDDQKSSTFLVKIGVDGTIVSVKEIFLSDTHLSTSLIQLIDDKIHLLGTYQLNDNHHFFKMVLDLDFRVASIWEYAIENRLIINGIVDNYIYGGVLSEQEGFDYALLKLENNRAEFYQFGTVKSEQIIGLSDTLLYTYSLSSSLQKTASLHIFNYDIEEIRFKNLTPSNLNIRHTYTSNFSENSTFPKSTINKGVEKLKMYNNINKIRRSTP